MNAEQKLVFDKGVACFKAKKYDDALKYFSKAIRFGDNYLALDSRAAIYERLARPKDALADARTMINAYPQRWQGYSRAARSFKAVKKFDSALKMIDKALETLRAEESKRRPELEALRAEVETAVKKQEDLAKQSRCHFGSLPVEIATVIFGLVVEADQTYVLKLAHICQHWRDIAINTPALWASLSLSETSKRVAAKVKFWQSRNHGKIKNLRISHLDDWAKDPLATLRADMSASLKSLTINQGDPQVISRLTVVKSAIPQLDSLEIRDLLRAFVFGEYDELKLRRLIVHSTLVDWPCLADRCTDLRELVFRGWFMENGMPDLLWLLHRNPHVEALELVFSSYSIVRFMPIPRNLPERIALPHLSSLTLGGSHLQAGVLLPPLSIGSLRSLRLLQLIGSLDQTLEYFLQGATLATLENLEISRCCVDNTGLIVQLFRTAAGLKSIQLNHMANGGAVLETLASATGEEMLCPNLTGVDFSHCPDVRDGSLVRLVKTRCVQRATSDTDPAQHSQVAKLHSLTIDGCERVDASILPWIKQHVPRVSCQYSTKKQASWKR